MDKLHEESRKKDIRDAKFHEGKGKKENDFDEDQAGPLKKS